MQKKTLDGTFDTRFVTHHPPARAPHAHTPALESTRPLFSRARRATPFVVKMTALKTSCAARGTDMPL